MPSNTKSIKCASCRVPAEVPANPKPQDFVICPKCGARDTFKNVNASLADQAAEHVQNQLARGLRSSKFLKVTTKPVQKRRHRFVVDLK